MSMFFPWAVLYSVLLSTVWLSDNAIAEPLREPHSRNGDLKNSNAIGTEVANVTLPVPARTNPPRYYSTPSGTDPPWYYSTPSGTDQPWYYSTPSGSNRPWYYSTPSGSNRPWYYSTPSGTNRPWYYSTPSGTNRPWYYSTPSGTNRPWYYSTPSRTNPPWYYSTPSRTNPPWYYSTSPSYTTTWYYRTSSRPPWYYSTSSETSRPWYYSTRPSTSVVYTTETPILPGCDCGPKSLSCSLDLEGRKKCLCSLGYAQVGNECSDCYCGENSGDCRFDTNGNKICYCNPGYSQKYRKCSAVCDSDGDCLNGGICARGAGGARFCRCRPGYSGDFCKVSEWCETVRPRCDAIGAICRENGTSAFCECPPEKAFQWQTGKCEDICDSRKCVHGSCEIFGKSYKCRCDDGFTGQHCDVEENGRKETVNMWMMFTWSIVVLFMAAILYMICKIRKTKAVIIGGKGDSDDKVLLLTGEMAQQIKQLK